MSFPVCIQDLTPQWLSEVMGQNIEEINTTRIGQDTGFSAEMFRVTWETDLPVNSVAIKLPTTGLSSELSGQLYLAEVNIYKNFKNIGCNFPKPYFAEIKNGGKEFIIVMEDLKEPYKLGNLTEGLTLADAKGALRELAGFHANWWNKKEKIHVDTGASIISIWGFGVGTCWENGGKEAFEKEELYSEEVDKAVKFVGKYSKAVHTKPLTLVHGDYRADNIMYWRGKEDIERKIVPFDFQIIHWGNPMEDVAYFLSNSVPADIIMENQEDLLTFYHNELIQRGVDVSDYSFEQCKFDYRENLIYCILLPVFGALSKIKEENMTESQKARATMAAQWRKRVTPIITFNKCSQIMEELGEAFEPFLETSPFPELEKTVATFVELLSKHGETDWSTRTVEQAKKALSYTVNSTKDHLAAIEEGIQSMIVFPCADSRPEMKVFSPENPTGKVLLYIPNAWLGGWQIAEPICRKICQLSNTHVVLVNHRSVPTSAHPEMLEDCYNALITIIESPGDLLVPAVKSVSVFGYGQGGHLVACLLRNLVEKNQISYVDKQILVCPWIDPTCSNDSYEKIGNRYNVVLGKDCCEFYWRYYASHPLEDFGDTEQPLKFSEEIMGQFPPILLITAEFDVTKPDADNYFDLLTKNGVKGEVKLYPGALYIFFNNFVPAGLEAMQLVASQI